MFSSYEESVVVHADEYGNLTLKVAEQLFADHGNDFWDARRDGMPFTLKAHKLLDWLGHSGELAEQCWFDLQAAG